MLSINKNDCLTCAIAEARNLSYKVVYNSIKTFGKEVYYNEKDLLGMKSISFIRAIFTKRPLVLIYSVNEDVGHAVAVINGRVVDNLTSSYNENMSVWWMIRNKNAKKIFLAK